MTFNTNFSMFIPATSLTSTAFQTWIPVSRNIGANLKTRSETRRMLVMSMIKYVNQSILYYFWNIYEAYSF